MEEEQWHYIELHYKNQANKGRKLLRQTKREFESRPKIAKNIKKDSKSFFKYVRSKTNAKSFVGPLTDEKGNLISDDKQMGELLNTFSHRCSPMKPQKPSQQ